MDNVNTQLNSDRVGDEREGPMSQLVISEEGQPNEGGGSSNFESTNLDPRLPLRTTSYRSRITNPTYESRTHWDPSVGEEIYAKSVCGPSMIIKGVNGKAGRDSAFHRLKQMSSAAEQSDKLPALPPPGSLGLGQDLQAKSVIKVAETGCPTRNRYRSDRYLCHWATFVTAVIVICAIAIMFVTIFRGKDSNNCRPIKITLIPTSVLIVFIVSLEWTRTWIWRGPKISNKFLRAKPGSASVLQKYGATSANNIATSSVLDVSAYTNSLLNTDSCSYLVNTGPQQNTYDVPQFVSALVLILLYSVLVAGIAATMATSATEYNNCSDLAVIGLIMSSLLAVFVVVRIMMCCLSDVCHGLCYRTNMMFKSSGDGPVPMLVDTQLNHTLPGLRQNDVRESGHSRAWLYNAATSKDPKEQLSITTPIPVKYLDNLS